MSFEVEIDRIKFVTDQKQIDEYCYPESFDFNRILLIKDREFGNLF